MAERVSDEEILQDIEHVSHFRLGIYDVTNLSVGYPDDLRDARVTIAKLEAENERLKVAADEAMDLVARRYGELAVTKKDAQTSIEELINERDMHSAEQDQEAARADRAEAALARCERDTLERAARIVEDNQEVFVGLSAGRFLEPRAEHNRSGLGYAAAIRAAIPIETGERG